MTEETSASASAQQRASTTRSSEMSSTTVIPPFGHSLSQSMTIKLDRDNFLLWKSLVLPVIKGYKLDGFLFGTTPCPPLMITETGLINPDYEDWVSRDQLLLGWLLNSLTESVASQIIGHSTSSDTWRAIEELCGAHNRAKIQLCRTGIQTTRKGSQTMVKYLNTMKEFADSLAAAGAPFSTADLISCTLAGLDAEYLSITTLLQDKPNLSWPDMHASLISFETKLQQLNSISGLSSSLYAHASLSSPSANAAVSNFGSNTSKSGSSNSSNASGNSSNNRSHQHNNRANNGGYRGGGRSRGRGGRHSNSSRPTCQICGKYGHSAAVCYYRGDTAYPGSPAYSPHQQSLTQPTAFITPSDATSDTAWYIDSGATSHVTADPSQLNNKSEYSEVKEVAAETQGRGGYNSAQAAKEEVREGSDEK